MLIKAAMIDKYKQAQLNIKSISMPSIDDNEILVKVSAASVNPIDSKIKDGDLKLISHHKMPLILGHDLAGTIVKVGANVSEYQIGDKVYGRPNDNKIGTFAEYIAVDPNDVDKIPDKISFTSAAALPLVSLTSYQALHDLMNIQPGQKVLIQAGSGGVGTIAIQIAKAMGAYVTTTTSAKNVALVRHLGADQVIDYHKENFQDVLSNYDYVFDTLGGKSLTAAFKIVKPGGKIVSVAGMPDFKFAQARHLAKWKQILFKIVSHHIHKLENQYHVEYQFLFMHASGKEMKVISSLVNEGKLHPVIDKIFPLDKINDALAYSQSGRAKGKIIIQMA